MINEHWTDRLSAYLDNDLTPAERAAAGAHLRICPACAAMLDELRAVTARAHALDDRAPANDLWPGIAAAIGSDISPLSPRRRETGGRRRFSFSVPQLAAAAVLLAALSGGVVWTLGMPRARSVAVAPAAPASPSRAGASDGTIRQTSFTTPRPTAEQSYDAAVADLERVVQAGQGRLDEKTLQIVRKNLAVIDTAVAQARRAVEQDPANSYLNSYLAHTMRRKIDLLRQVATLASARS
jgi:anti-sigma factor RsiW